MLVKPIATERTAQDTPKSRRTRARILDAAMRLFAEVGYHAASNARIADGARLTRGAMLYHFASREELVAAAVDHIHAARMARLAEAGRDQGPGSDPAEHAIEAYWRLLGETPFVAFAELEAVGRTDPQIADLIAPAQAEFDRAQIGDQPLASPRLQAGRDLARFMLEGMARARLTYDGEDRAERLLAVIKRATHMLNRKGATADLWPE